MRAVQTALVWMCVLALAVVAEKKEHNGKTEQEVKPGKRHHTLGHWGEHWSMVGKPTSKHESKDSMRHAPDLVPHHEAKMQYDLGYKKMNHDKHKAAAADLHLQDLLMEESQRHETRMQKIQKARPTHSSSHRQEVHQIPKPRPTFSAASHTNLHGHLENHNMHSHHGKPTPATGHKANKGHLGPKQRKGHSKEKKQDKKFPKKYNPRKHEKKMMKQH